jgi:hypothetical protein
VIICEIIVHLLVIVQNNKRCTVLVLKYLHKYSGPSKVEHNPFQEAVRLSGCPTFKLNEHEPHDAVQCRAHGSTFEFLFEFQTEFFSNFLFEFQVVRESNRSTLEGPSYLPSLNRVV